MTPISVTTRHELRESLAGLRPGLVPTMGAFHEGHLALIERSARENEQTVVSIFVNPTQFGNQSDLARYPRDIERDSALATEVGATHIFAPSVDAIYPPGFDSWVEVGDLASRWEGASRPDHFRGVATIVTILLNLVQPARSYFGKKDFQQLQIIRRMHDDLALPGQIVACETVRAPDGLALSSRNMLLLAADRERARAIPNAIDAIRQAVANGEGDVSRLQALGRSILAREGLAVDYLAIVDIVDLKQLTGVNREARLLVATKLGGVRLIDNAAITIESGEPA
jgi:pantoate--beta-alanine ligase